jgi:hypothetical protein
MIEGDGLLNLGALEGKAVAIARVFRPGDDWRRDTVVGIHEDRISYIVRYQSAANALVELALAERLQDLYFLPICYLYRHAIELSLKDLIDQTDRLICLLVKCGSIEREACRKIAPVEKKLSRTHDLKVLLEELIERFGLIQGEPFSSDVRAAVEEINAFDSSGQKFRYPKLKQGELSFRDQQHYDLRHLRDAMSGVLRYFDGMGAWIDQQQMNAVDLANYLAE